MTNPNNTKIEQAIILQVYKNDKWEDFCDETTPFLNIGELDNRGDIRLVKKTVTTEYEVLNKMKEEQQPKQKTIYINLLFGNSLLLGYVYDAKGLLKQKPAHWTLTIDGRFGPEELLETAFTVDKLSFEVEADTDIDVFVGDYIVETYNLKEVHANNWIADEVIGHMV